MILRPATAADVDAIAALHVASWRATYRGVLPGAFLDGAVVQELTGHWRDALSNPAGRRLTLIVGRNGPIAGFATAVPSEDPAFDAYIEHVHVRPGLTGAGIGRRLLAALARHLLGCGRRSAYLLVFSSNRAAIGFYERLGGSTEAFGLEEIAGARIPRSRVVWPELAKLVAAAASEDR